MKTGSEELYKQTDFYRRFSKFLTRGLKDHRYGAEFALDAKKRYTDDADKAKFEIGTYNNEQFRDTLGTERISICTVNSWPRTRSGRCPKLYTPPVKYKYLINAEVLFYAVTVE